MSDKKAPPKKPTAAVPAPKVVVHPRKIVRNPGLTKSEQRFNEMLQSVEIKRK